MKRPPIERLNLVLVGVLLAATYAGFLMVLALVARGR